MTFKLRERMRNKTLEIFFYPCVNQILPLTRKDESKRRLQLKTDFFRLKCDNALEVL